MKIKKIGNALHIVTGEDSVIVPMSTPSEIEKCTNTLIEVIYQVSHKNAELEKLVANDSLVESYDTKSSLPLLNDVLMNVPSHVSKSAKDAIQFAPSALQPQVIKQFANAISRVYKDAAEMILASDDSTLLARSLLQKSVMIGRDVELLADKLDEPLQKVKAIKFEREMRKSVLRKGVEQGKLQAMTHYGSFDKDVLETARSIQSARNVTEGKSQQKQKAIKDALRLAQK